MVRREGTGSAPGGAPRGDLDALIDRVVADPAYGDGARKAADEWITPDEAVLVLEDFYQAHDQADLVIPEVARRLGHELACKAGCGRCCVCMVLISVPEALVAARWLSRPEHSAQLEQFRARASEWAIATGAWATAAADACHAGRTMDYRRLIYRHAAALIQCPANVDGSCQLHPARPLPCRRVWVADTDEHCVRTGDPAQPVPARLTYDRFEILVEQGRRLSAGMQHLMGRGVRRDPLPLAILAALDEIQ